MPSSTGFRLLIPLLGIALLLNLGCVKQLTTGKLPDGITVTKLAEIQAGSPFAVSPDGRKIALSHNGLQILTIPDGSTKPIQAVNPSAVDWSPDGNRVAVAVQNSFGTSLSIFSANGEPLNSTEVKTPITSLTWLNNNEIAAIGILITTYKFGANAATILYRWDGKGAPVQLSIKESTLRPGTAASLAKELFNGSKVAFSRLRDELVFLHPQDPPLFTPFYKVIIRNLSSGSTKEIGKAKFGTGAPLFADDGESVIVTDALTSRYDSWGNTNPKPINLSGKTIGISPGSSYWLTSGALYKDGTLLFSINDDAYGIFSSKGDCLFVVSGELLYRIDGLKDNPLEQLSASQSEKLIQLRAWRTEGLVSPEEYRTSKERIFVK